MSQGPYPPHDSTRPYGAPPGTQEFSGSYPHQYAGTYSQTGGGPMPSGPHQVSHIPPQRHPLTEPPKPHRIWMKALVGVLAVLGVLFIAIVVFAPGPSSTGQPAPSATGSSTSSRATTASGSSPNPVIPSGPAREITAREWAKIAKDPQSAVGQKIIVYGQVTQFDAVTGTDGFRANVDGVKHQVSYGYADYETNTILGGDASTLADLVEKDLFRAEVVVAGAYTYETTMGGQTTVPLLKVVKIQTTGSAK